MTTAKWITTWYFWAPMILAAVMVVWIYFKEKGEEDTCPTCYSTRKKDRYTVRYWMSDYVYNDSPCEDKWHRRR